MVLPSRVRVLVDERFFTVQAENMDTDTTRLNSNEKKIIRTQHWRSIEEILYSSETIFPRNLIVELLSVS